MYYIEFDTLQTQDENTGKRGGNELKPVFSKNRKVFSIRLNPEVYFVHYVARSASITSLLQPLSPALLSCFFRLFMIFLIREL